jgi:hypothetical protein
MVQLYVPNVSVVCCIQVFRVSEVECHGGHDLGAVGWSTMIHGLTFGACNAPRILCTGRARPHFDSARLEIEEGSRERSSGRDISCERVGVWTRGHGRRRGPREKERQAQPFPWARMMKVVRAAGCKVQMARGG